jgi:decaprenylphospho-beta-D-erythro-pentofuranosid-2-ulose 2-reductase
VLVLGGTSEIGLAIARQLAGPRRAAVVLAGRDPAGLESAAASLKEAGAGRVETLRFDAVDTAGHDAVVAEAARLAGGDLDVVVFAFGVLGDQAAAEAGGAGAGAGAVEVATTNYVGAVSAGLAVAGRLRAQGHGTLVALSSVAGVRVRRANFIYGSSKSGMDGFFQGLADSLAGTGARVLIVRPGFVRTRMTDGMDAAPLSTTADAVAAATVKGLQTGQAVVWVPPVLRLVFAGFRLLPRAAWRRIPG